MHLTTIDFLVIAGYFVLAIGTASVFIKRARRAFVFEDAAQSKVVRFVTNDQFER